MRNRLNLSVRLTILLLLLTAENLFAATYTYTVNQSPTWYSAQKQSGRFGTYWTEGSLDVTSENEKMLTIGTFLIDDLTSDTLDANPDNNWCNLHASTYTGWGWAEINGPFSGAVTTENPGDGRYSNSSKLRGRNFSLYMQYEDKDGVHIITLASVNNPVELDYKIMLNPPKGQTSITCKVFLVTDAVKMEQGKEYDINFIGDNSAFTWQDNKGHGIGGTGFNLHWNTYVKTGTTVDSHSSGEEEIATLDATVRLLSYPNREELASGSEITLPNNAAKLALGVPLAYLRADFSDKNTGGDKKSLLIKITHDEFQPQTNNGNKSYSYQLSLSQDLLNGNVTTEYGNNGQEDGTGLLSYRLKNSQPNDFDSKLITFTMPESEDFQNARPGTYTSNVLIVTSVE